MTRRSKRQRLKARAQWLEERLAAGSPHKGVVTRWQRELKRTRAMLLALDHGRPAGLYPDYLHLVQ